MLPPVSVLLRINYVRVQVLSALNSSPTKNKKLAASPVSGDSLPLHSASGPAASANAAAVEEPPKVLASVVSYESQQDAWASYEQEKFELAKRQAQPDTPASWKDNPVRLLKILRYLFSDSHRSAQCGIFNAVFNHNYAL